MDDVPNELKGLEELQAKLWKDLWNNFPNTSIRRGGIKNHWSIPWNDPNSDPLQDIIDAKEQARRDHLYNHVSSFPAQVQLPNEERPAFLARIEEYERNLNMSSAVEAEARYDEQRQLGKDADSVAIVSGGLDSTTLVYHMMFEQGFIPHLLSFDYGQRHGKELIYAKQTARTLGLRHNIIDLTGLTHLISNSALTSRSPIRNARDEPLVSDAEIEVPEGHYAAETMKATVVPNRNMIMLSIAAGVAVNNKYRVIATGVHAGDHDVYPDCRPGFIDSCERTIALGNEGFANFKLDPTATYDEPIYAPFIHKTKADIAYEALELGVPLHLTWSCYKGGDIHCGRCSTCVERLEAIDEAQQRWFGKRDGNPPSDRTEYVDKEFWKQAVREFKETQR